MLSTDAMLEPDNSRSTVELPRRRLLLVEDDRRTHDALRKIFARLGWDVQSATTVSGGLALLDQKPDALILDLMLPDGDGIDILRKARADSPMTRIAVTTGVEDRERLEAVCGCQPDALLRKPLELGDLLRVFDPA